MGETTEIIHKRIRHTKTTLAGIAGIVCPILALCFPSHAVPILTVGCALNGMGNIAAADAKPKTTIEAK
jgi:hypothetical protein